MRHAIHTSSRRSVAERAGLWSARHRRKAILGWVGFVLVAFLVGGSLGQHYLREDEMSNGDTQRALQAYASADFPELANEQVLVQARDGTRVTDPAFAAAIHDVAARLRGVPFAVDVRSPLVAAYRGQISPDGRSALVTFRIRGTDKLTQERVGAALAATAAAQRAHPALRIEEFGDASADKALAKSYGDDFRTAERTSLPVTLAILLIAFGSLVAAGIPLLLGLTAVLGTLGLIAPLSRIVPVAEGTIDSVVLLIGLAVGVDYSMFYLRRKLEERHTGHDGPAALQIAAATSGRAVLVSGLTVMTAMAGMFAAGNGVFTSFAVGTMLVVAVALVGSLTVLPAVMAALGDRVERLRVPIVAGRRARGDSRAWGFILDRVLRVPALSLALGTAALIALALPALQMHTVDPGVVGLPRSLPVMRTYDRIQAAFPGGPLPAVVVVRAPDVTAPAVQGGIAAMTRDALATREMGGPVSVSVSPDRTVAAVKIALAGNGADARSEAALATLRERVIPATIGTVAGTGAWVAGQTAGSKDFNDTMRAHLPYVFAFVLGLAFVLLLVTFRSVVIPITGIALNMLSVGAAYGVLKLIFQDGHLQSVLGFASIGGVIDWLPLFLFVILFGLSMDYHVLILSRVREEHERGRSTADAVATALKATAGVVTSAAVVMVAVFSIFATLGAIEFKQLGVGLAVAVLIDATIVRAVLLPSAMKLLGEWNWYLPRRRRAQRVEPPGLGRRRLGEPAVRG